MAPCHTIRRAPCGRACPACNVVRDARGRAQIARIRHPPMLCRGSRRAPPLAIAVCDRAGRTARSQFCRTPTSGPEYASNEPAARAWNDRRKHPPDVDASGRQPNPSRNRASLLSRTGRGGLLARHRFGARATGAACAACALIPARSDYRQLRTSSTALSIVIAVFAADATRWVLEGHRTFARCAGSMSIYRQSAVRTGCGL